MLTQPEQDLHGCRILVVEDDPMLAFVFKMYLEECGGKVVGPANSLDAAFRLLEQHEFDCAVMDVRLNNETVFSLAAQMQEIGIPFAFVTGNSMKTLPPEFHDKPLLLKPVNFEQLASVIVNMTHRVHDASPQRAGTVELPAR